jgi:glycosyltransferase involved in cell wall biosynthesis
MSQPWPILLLVRELGSGGSERQLTEIARAIDRSQFQPHVGCMRAQGMRLEELRQAGVGVLHLPVQSLYGFSALTGARVLKRYLQEHSIKLVHTFDTPTTIWGVPAARMAGAPVVLSSQRAYRELTPPLGRRLLRITDRMVDGVVVNCQAVVRHLVEDEGVEAAKVSLCYNGIDTSTFQPGPPTRMNAMKDADLVFGTVCVLRAEKRVDLLLEAFAKIAASGRKLAIVGSGPELAALEQQSARLLLGANCHFEPATAAVASWLHSIDIFVLPTRSEALSNSLMEAMACGCAVVASDTGGNPELVSDRSNGLLFPSGDARALASLLDLLAKNSALRSELAGRASATIAQRFTVAVSAARMAEIYREKLA